MQRVCINKLWEIIYKTQSIPLENKSHQVLKDLDTIQTYLESLLYSLKFINKHFIGIPFDAIAAYIINQKNIMKIIKFLLLTLVSTSIFAQSNNSEEYYRHLRYNHVSPYIDVVGIYPIDKSIAESTSHYKFSFDDSNRLVEIVNNHFHTEKKHPLASIGVYRVTITYQDGKETRTFFDSNGKRISNDRDVYKEVYHYDKKGFKNSLSFYYIDDQPMESNWKIAKYEWKKHKKFIVEKRFNLSDVEVSVSPYFKFGTTGISLYKNGAPKAHYNLNTDLEVANDETGIASYRDTFDDEGNHTKYTYHDISGVLKKNQWNFAIGEKVYDSIGNNIKLVQMDENEGVIRSRDIYTNSRIEFSAIASKNDSLDIRKKSLGYLIALQQLKPELMDTVMNDSLNKVTIGYDRQTQKEYARATTRTQMMAFAKDWNKSNMKFPFKPNNKVRILDIYNRVASVRLTSDNWVEYLHLIKLDGKWDIVNLIWQHKDISRYPK